MRRPLDYVLVGIAVAFLGGFVALVGGVGGITDGTPAIALVGIVGLATGSALVWVGVIAQGVKVGLEQRRESERVRP